MKQLNRLLTKAKFAHPESLQDPHFSDVPANPKLLHYKLYLILISPTLKILTLQLPISFIGNIVNNVV